MEETKDKDYSKRPYNPHGAGCKGHQIYMLDGSIEDEDYRKAMLLALDNYDH